jgi:hypothetical protein
MLLFALLTYGIVFLVADARMFGCDAKKWNVAGDPVRDCRDIGILKIRQRLLRYDFFSELLGCYFCTGCYAGPVAHWLLICGLGTAYPLYPQGPAGAAVIMTLVSIPLGGVVAFGIDTILLALEKDDQ